MKFDIEKLKMKKEAMDMFIDMFAEATGDPRVIVFKKCKDFNRKLQDISLNENVTDEQFNQISGLLDQFEELIDDVLKEEK